MFAMDRFKKFGTPLRLMIILTVSLSGLVWWATRPVVYGQGGETPLANLNENNIKQATVFIMQTRNTVGGPVISCVGSGTLISADGLILTNAHHVESTATCPTDRIVIGVTLRLDEPPVPIYGADITEVNRGLDLAVLRITSFLDGRSIEVGSLELPFVELGNSDQVSVDDTVLVVGYPEIGNDPVAAVRVTVAGFTAEANFGDRSWIRTTADIPGTMSGGGMYDSSGRLIGVPTIAPARVAGTVVDCREVYDTNANGQIDENDSCIPISGAINAIRPSRLARGLVRAAALNIEVGPERSPQQAPPPSGDPTFSRLIVSTGVNEAGMPTSVITGAPQGVTSLFLFFDYDNMEDGLVYELRTTIDGRPSPVDSLPPVTWSGGHSGLWYIGGTRIPRPNGTYQFTLLVEGRQVATSALVTIGGGPRTSPQFSDIIFGIQSAGGELIGANYVIPEGNIIRSRFSFSNMQPGLQWRQRWYQGRAEIQNILNPWERTESQGTSNDPSIQNEGGFPSGRYRLELYIILQDGTELLSATADFVVAGGAGGANDAEAQIFSNFRFAQSERNTLPVGIVAESYPTGTEAIYIFFDWRQINTGTPWKWRWYLDDELLLETNTQWSADLTGENYFISLVGAPNLPDGTYRFEIEMAGILQTDIVEAEVGIGQLPVEAFASAEGVRMSGQILDAETGQGIPGALFIVLLSEYSIEDFTWRGNQVLGQAEADEEGFFQIPSLLPRGTVDEPQLYSVLIRADGYLPINADGIEVTTETESPVVLNVEMNRD